MSHPCSGARSFSSVKIPSRQTKISGGQFTGGGVLQLKRLSKRRKCIAHFTGSETIWKIDTGPHWNMIEKSIVRVPPGLLFAVKATLKSAPGWPGHPWPTAGRPVFPAYPFRATIIDTGEIKNVSFYGLSTTDVLFEFVKSARFARRCVVSEA